MIDRTVDRFCRDYPTAAPAVLVRRVELRLQYLAKLGLRQGLARPHSQAEPPDGGAEQGRPGGGRVQRLGRPRHRHLLHCDSLES